MPININKKNRSYLMYKKMEIRFSKKFDAIVFFKVKTNFIPFQLKVALLISTALITRFAVAACVIPILVLTLGSVHMDQHV